MNLTIKIENGYIQPLEVDKLKDLKDGIYQVKLNNMDLRTIRQNSAIHKYYDLVAQELNNRNLSVVTVLKPDIMWTVETVKEQLWKPIQYSILNKKSTTQLTKSEIDKVYDVMNKALGEKFGFYVPFPSMEE